MTSHRVAKYTATSLLIGFLTLHIYAEPIRSGYYDAAQGLSDSLLKSALHDTICQGVRVSYGTQGYTYPEGIYYPATWNYLPLTDRRADGTVWDMYSNTRRYFPSDEGSACGLQIEHCFPKSWWGWTSSSSGKTDSIGYRAYRDLYHLSPADAQANNSKSNCPPGHVSKGDKLDNGSFRMDSKNASQYGWMCFEPAPEYRGDFARAYFYIATAYENLTWVSTYSDYLTNDSYLEFQPWLIDVLLDWHRSDPVSIKEIERADAVSSIQHNRNPFIDYPELVEYIWGNKKGQSVDFERLICTASPDYVPTPDLTNFRAYEATNITRTGFTATWTNLSSDCTIDLYTRSYTGNNDTLVSLPTITTKRIDSTAHVDYSGKLSTTYAGNGAVVMGSSNTDATIRLYGLQLPRGANLVFRAGMYAFATAGELQIFLNEETAPFQTIVLPTSRDENYYTIAIPAGTQTIQIASVGGSTKKRAAMQELYLIQGDLQAHTQSIEGYPQTIDATPMASRYCSQYLSLSTALASDTLYYRISDDNGRRTNEIAVVLPAAPSTDLHPATPYSAPQKVLRNGRIYIFYNGKYYTLLGNIDHEQ